MFFPDPKACPPFYSRPAAAAIAVGGGGQLTSARASIDRRCGASGAAAESNEVWKQNCARPLSESKHLKTKHSRLVIRGK